MEDVRPCCGFFRRVSRMMDKWRRLCAPREGPVVGWWADGWWRLPWKISGDVLFLELPESKCLRELQGLYARCLRKLRRNDRNEGVARKTWQLFPRCFSYWLQVGICQGRSSSPFERRFKVLIPRTLRYEVCGCGKGLPACCGRKWKTTHGRHHG